MATKDTGGMNHLTVVPENFDPDATGKREDADAATDTESPNER